VREFCVAEHALGIDAGYPKPGRSTGLCLLSIENEVLNWEFLY